MDDKLKAQHWLYLLFVASLPLATLLQFTLFGAEMQLSDLLYLATAVVWVIALVLGRQKLRWSWFYLPLAAYGVSVILSTITSADPTLSAVKLAGKLYLIGIAFLSFNLITTIGILRSVLKAWVLGAAIVLFVSLLGIVLFYAGLKDPAVNLVVHPISGSLPTGDYPRIEGLFLYPAVLCNFLGVTWAFALLLASTGWLRKSIFWPIAIGLFIVNAFTLTPGLGGIFLSTSYFLREKYRNRQKLMPSRAVMAAGILIAAGFLFAASVALFSYGADGTQIPLETGKIKASHRAQAWSMAFETFKQHPITGKGVGLPVAGVLFAGPSGNHLLTDAHNTYLSVLSETGIVGFFLS